MKRVVVPLALVFSAGLALACPGSDKEMNAQAPASAQLAAATAKPAATTPAVSVKQQDTKAVSKKTPAAETAKKTTGS